ncbi:MAG: hypothetical protein WBM17_07545 [Anaerolineales bacterium]
METLSGTSIWEMSKREAAIVRPFRDADLEPVRALIYKTIDACYAGVYPPRAVEFFRQ